MASNPWVNKYQEKYPDFSTFTSASSLMESREEKAPTSETASYWTEEKHVQFLNSMEASFVSEMIQNNDGSSFRPLCLRRHVSPSSDSTSDLKPHTASANHTLSGNLSVSLEFHGLWCLLGLYLYLYLNGPYLNLFVSDEDWMVNFLNRDRLF